MSKYIARPIAGGKVCSSYPIWALVGFCLLMSLAINAWAADAKQSSSPADTSGKVPSKAVKNKNENSKAEQIMSSVENNTRVSDKVRQGIFAVVDGVKIDLEDFLHVYRSGVRNTFYHARVRKEEVTAFRQKIVTGLITDELLAQEAKRRGLRVTKDTVSNKVDLFVEKNKKSKGWDKIKARLIPALKRIYEREELVKLLKADVEELEKPENSKIFEYYNTNKDKFTAPERWHISLILLSVDPSSSGAIWDEAFETASRLVERVRDGESFEEFARIHSSDPSAADGGDMGYIHIGMLSKPAQEVLNIMKVGDISEPVMLLKGVAVFRLDGLEAPRLNKFEKVKQRAGDLLQRKRQSETWESLRKSIWKGKKITLADEFAEYLKAPTE